ncbi:DUF456 domain-containing protein [Luteolibacter marinus]|uniref:DUF456 domain-containing protein n=1 Tax=Luteolibacter marinus TaxID=2776705 RepID=UPI001867CDE8|nr:DUF456 domain-containing protein [Luteolibacter marinus]
MWEMISQWSGWGSVGYVMAWIITGSLLLAGLAGCVIPVLPGHLILVLAAIGHRLMLGREESGVEWWTFVVLVLMLAVSQAFEFAAGAAGTRWFGGTRWGAWGALLGGIVGMFFFPFGLLIGPLVGAFAFERGFAKKELKPAAYSGVGSVVGTLAGMGMKVAVGVAMILWFIIDSFWIG